MTRREQEKARKGSQKWLQVLVNRHCELIDGEIRDKLHLDDRDTIEWQSPLEEDTYTEYRDDDFLRRLSVSLPHRSLDSYWPKEGPAWDGLARTGSGNILMVEAKSHIKEMKSICKAGQHSLSIIRDSLDKAAKYYGHASGQNWLDKYYQYANRLAHLYLLRKLNDVPAWLIFLYFVNDTEMGGPRSVAEWQNAIDGVHQYLGLAEERLRPYVVDIFVDINNISD